MKRSSFISCGMIAAAMLPTPAVAHPHDPMPPVASEAPAEVKAPLDQQSPSLRDVIETHGLDELYRLTHLDFTVSFKGPDAAEQKTSRTWEWELQKDALMFRRSSNGSNIGLNIDRSKYRAGFMFSHIEEQFTSDRKWLFWPFGMRSGYAHVTKKGEQELPIGTGNGFLLEVRVPAALDPNHSPNDIYELYVNSDGRILQWIYREGGQRPGIATQFKKYEKQGPFLFPSELVDRQGQSTWLSVLKIELSSVEKKTHEVGSGPSGFDMVWMQPGTFVMGSPDNEPDRGKDENQHQVTLTKGFYLGETEVTQAQYRQVMGKLPKDCGTSNYWGEPNGDLAVGGVSWSDAIAFCKKLTELERKAGRLPKGMSFQLPTEAEWEYACRAGTTTTYWWGNEPDRTKANFDGYGVKPVGQYRPNPWGLHDMHGNVYEWCNDGSKTVEEGETPYPDGPITDPAGLQADTLSKIQRGGGYWSHASQIRSAYRHSHPHYDTIDYKGFRVALKTDSPSKPALTSEVSLPAAEDDAPAGEVEAD